MDARNFILHNSTENTYRKTTDRVLCTLLKVRNELFDGNLSTAATSMASQEFKRVPEMSANDLISCSLLRHNQLGLTSHTAAIGLLFTLHSTLGLGAYHFR